MGGHKVVCTKWRKEREETKARGELTMHERSVAVVKAGYKHTLTYLHILNPNAPII